MSLAQRLAQASGVYVGTGDGVESGPFVSRIEVAGLPNGGVSIDYEATSREHGVQHREHTLLVAGADGRDRLFVAHSESPFVTEMVAVEADSSRFHQPAPSGRYVMEIVIEFLEPDRITYAWWWAEAGEVPIEQSKADARRLAP
ncbi:MAG: hypothetical protein ABMA25_01350 [Ilumatobacteraceae bacterium]